jgi:bifunctional DNase/RNase
MPSNQPIVLLRESAGSRYLPIWVGASEATAIAFAQQGVVPPRPLTHDLLKDVLDATGNTLTEVQITEVRDGVFYAILILGEGIEVSARPSDSIALALRTGSRIVCSEEVLDEAGLDVPDDQEEEVEKFREFLDKITAEDFEAEK